MAEDSSYNNMKCILFPGIVKNFDKAIELLGGMQSIQEALSTKEPKELQLSFQPENPYVKKIPVEMQEDNSFLIKVRLKKSKVDGVVKKEVFSTKVLGLVTELYTFEALADAQILPLVNEKPEEKPRCVFDELVPNFMESVQFLRKDVPYFLPPMHVFKNEKLVNIGFFDLAKTSVKRTDPVVAQPDIKLDRKQYSYQVNFSMDCELPTSPSELTLKRYEEKKGFWPKMEEKLQKIKEMFDARPINSRMAIAYETKYDNTTIKITMACVAYMMTGGPWHTQYCRYGYDPRVNPEARMYQILDFKYKYIDKKKKPSDPKIKKMRTFRPRKNYAEDLVASEDALPSEAQFRLRPGLVPERMGTIYPLYEIQLPEVQALLASLPEVMPGTLCHPKRGWLPNGTLEQIRNIITEYADNAYGIKRNVKTEDTSSTDISDEDEEPDSKSDDDDEMITGI